MGVFEDLEKFLEARLEQFLQANPQLQVRILLEQVREEEVRAQQTLVLLRREEKDIYSKILDTAQAIKKWVERKQKALTNNRPDLAEAAQQRERELLTEGNNLWNRKNEVIDQIAQNEALLKKLSPRRQELEAKLEAEQPVRPKRSPDDLEAQFQAWEIDQALQDLKKKTGW
jgi:uncharacterized protein (TIGR04376 family)